MCVLFASTNLCQLIQETIRVMVQVGRIDIKAQIGRQAPRGFSSMTNQVFKGKKTWGKKGGCQLYFEAKKG